MNWISRSVLLVALHSEVPGKTKASPNVVADEATLSDAREVCKYVRKLMMETMSIDPRKQKAAERFIHRIGYLVESWQKDPLASKKCFCKNQWISYFSMIWTKSEIDSAQRSVARSVSLPELLGGPHIEFERVDQNDLLERARRNLDVAFLILELLFDPNVTLKVLPRMASELFGIPLKEVQKRIKREVKELRRLMGH